MIITRIYGGLGNQLFQYAAGKALATRNKTELMLDLSDYSEKAYRKYELNNFKIEAGVYPQKKLIGKYRHYPNFIEKVIFGLTGKKIYSDFVNDNVYLEKKLFEYDTNFDRLSDNTYVAGFWQNEKYFKNIRKTLLGQLILKNECIDKKTLTMLNRIKIENSVSIHIRRTDYLEDPKYFITSKQNYYDDAIKYTQTREKMAKFFVFTDDPCWVKDNFIKNENMSMVSGNGLTGSQELYLMSNCKHNIITNSSFSWWGAWLNKNIDKIVISPRHWFKSKEFNSDEIILKEWIKI